MKIDMDSAGPKEWGEVLARATQLGAGHAHTTTNLRGNEIAGLLCSRWRVGDARALRAAYAFGKWRMETDFSD